MRKVLVPTLVALLFGFTSHATASISFPVESFQMALPANNEFDSDLMDLGFDEIFTAEFAFSQAVSVAFYYHAAESGYVDSFEIDGVVAKTEPGSPYDGWNPLGEFIGSISIAAGETIGEAIGTRRLEFTTTGSSGIDALLGTAGFGVFGFDGGITTSNGNDPRGPRYYFGYDDNGAGPDDNHDDMIISMQIIPEPGSLAIWAGLVGVCVIRRRRAT